jgi:hypothetical protein
MSPVLLALSAVATRGKDPGRHDRFTSLAKLSIHDQSGGEPLAGAGEAFPDAGK